MHSMNEFEDKVAVVTGAASGIGRALAEKFAAAGCRLMLADMDDAGLSETKSLAEKHGVKVEVRHCDVSRQDSVDALADASFEGLGAVHILCNNAGVLSGGISWEVDIKDYQWQLGVNTFGVIHGVRSFVPRMIAQDTPGHVVNTASMAALTTMPFAGAYHMSKHAVLAFSECLYHEMKLTQSKLGVSVLCPELIDTGIARSERVRPESYKNPDGAPPITESGKMVVGALADGMAKGGLDPSVMADRVFDAIQQDRFYILAEDSWRDACNTRLEDIRLGRNPTFSPPSV
jgi:NAD(P)-dependent dehydrogenase (short-subunit alcohol dehydrogenase family)